MGRCERIKSDGERCKARATAGRPWCYNHDPDRATERSANARKGGKAGGNGRPGRQLEQVEKQLERTDKVLDAVITANLIKDGAGMLVVKDGSGTEVVQACQGKARVAEARIRLVEAERKIVEDEIREEVRELREIINQLPQRRSRHGFAR